MRTLRVSLSIAATVIATAAQPYLPAAAAQDGWSPQPVGDELSLEFYTRQGTRVRARADGSVYVGTIDGLNEDDASDANFIKRAGLSNGGCVSFESVKWPGRFLRRQGNRVRVEGHFWWAGNEDATFCLMNQRYEAIGNRGYYLRNSGSELMLSRIDAWGDEAALFDTILFEHPPASLGLLIWGAHSWTQEGDNDIVMSYGRCTGRSLFWWAPITTSVSQTLYHRYIPPWGTPRTVVHRVTSTPFYGFYPWIKVTRKTSGGIFKIERGQMVCAW